MLSCNTQEIIFQGIIVYGLMLLRALMDSVLERIESDLAGGEGMLERFDAALVLLRSYGELVGLSDEDGLADDVFPFLSTENGGEVSVPLPFRYGKP